MMGLDICAYSHLEFVRARESRSTDYDDDLIYVYVDHKDHRPRLDGRPEGYYRAPARSMTHSFRAGSYSGYNRWREHLCAAALGCAPGAVWDHPADYAGKPFVELINFSDCEGAIGPETSAKLAEDFRRHDPTTFATFDEWDVDRYRHWRRAFTLAAEDGFVLFR